MGQAMGYIKEDYITGKIDTKVKVIEHEHW